MKLTLVKLLLGIHKIIEYKVLKETGGHVRVDGARVYGEFLPGDSAVLYKLVHKVVNGAERLETEGCYEVVIFARNGYELRRAEKLAVAHNALHYLGERFALFAVEYGLLFFGKFHMFFSFVKIKASCKRPKRPK